MTGLTPIRSRFGVSDRAPARLYRGFHAAPPPSEPDGDEVDPDAPDEEEEETEQVPEIIAGDEATLFVYDPIDNLFIDGAAFAAEIAAMTVSTLHVRINSPGGDVFLARAMKTALEASPARIVAHIDGLAASAASFLMLAADEIRIADGAFVMIHEAWTVAFGTADDFRKTAGLLDKMNAAIANDYAKKTGKPVASIAAAMAEETWYSAAEAVAFGLCDAVETFDAAPQARKFDLSAYRRAPVALTGKPLAETVAAAPPAAASAPVLSPDPPPDSFDPIRAHRQARLELYRRAA